MLHVVQAAEQAILPAPQSSGTDCGVWLSENEAKRAMDRKVMYCRQNLVRPTFKALWVNLLHINEVILFLVEMAEG